MTVPRKVSLDDWLRWLEKLHPSEIDLGLDRVARVAARLDLGTLPVPMILVGGTNGKGSTVAMLERLYRQAGYRTAAYTSPHIVRFNERMRIDAVECSDADILRALQAVEAKRGDESLTYFEFTTLAAVWLFLEQGVDVLILEVGLGGRLDATNLWDPDVAIITSIALDHQSWLGSDREQIAVEKGGIGRTGRPLILGDPAPPASLLELAAEKHFDLRRVDPVSVPGEALPGAHQSRNLACALEAIRALHTRLPVDLDGNRIGQSLAGLRVAGRYDFRVVQGVPHLLDVAHNPAAAKALAATLSEQHPGHRVHAVFATLSDKDLRGVVTALQPQVSHWYLTELDGARATPLDTLCAGVIDALCSTGSAVHDARAMVSEHRRPAEALAAARVACRQDIDDNIASLILITGSFMTLAALADLWS